MGKKSRFKRERTANLSLNSELNSETKLSLFSSKAIEYLLYAIIILVPLIYWNNVSPSILKTSIFGLLILAALFFWIIKITETGKFPFKLNFITISAIIFIFGVVLSTIFSQIPDLSFWGSERTQGLKTFLFYFLFFIIFISTVRNEKQIKNVISILVWISLPLSIIGIFQYYGLSFIPLPVDIKLESGGYRAIATFGNPIFFGGWLAIVIPLAIYKIIDSWNNSSKKFTFFFASILLLDIVALFMTFTRGAIFSFLASAFIFILIFAIIKKIRWLWISSIVAVILVIITLVSLNLPSNPLHIPKNAITARFTNIFSSGSTGFSRIQIWKLVKKPILEHPMLGVGPDAFGPLSLSKKYYNEELMKNDFSSAQKYVDRAHNIFLDSLLSFGIIGTFAYFAMIIYAVVLLIKLIRAPSVEIAKKYFFIALLVAFFAYLSQGMAEFSETSIYMMVFILLAVAYFYAVNSRDNDGVLAKTVKLKFIKEPWWLYLTGLMILAALGWYLIYLPWSADAKCSEGKIWINNSKLKGYALDLFREAHAFKYHDEECTVNLYRNLIEIADVKKYPDIEQELISAHKKWPEEGYYTMMLVNLYDRWGKSDNSKYAEADKVLDEALNYYGVQSSFYHAYIYYLTTRGDFPKADEKIKEALSKTKYMQDYYYYWAAKGALNFGAPDEALKYLDMIGKSNILSLNSFKYQTMGNIYGQKDDLPKALDFWMKCIEVDPTNTNCLRNISADYLNDKQFDKAVEYANKLKEIDAAQGKELLNKIDEIKVKEK